MTTVPQPVRDADPDPGAFRTTRWTRVCRAKDDSEEGRRALADLCEAYYEPVVAYLRGALRSDDDAARELTHAFFAKVLAGGAFDSADPERGRFRYYLLGAVKHFLAHRREADGRLRRGGGIAPCSLDEAGEGSPALHLSDTSRPSPEAAFDRQWAVTVLARAMAMLEAECAAGGKSALFHKLRPSLLGDASYGDQIGVADALGMSVPALKVAAHRLRRRFRECVRAEIEGTLQDRAAVEDEMRSLYAALS